MEALRPHLNFARAEAVRWLGDWHPLMRQIAPGEGIAQPDPSASPRSNAPLVDAPSLYTFLLHYKDTVLLPFELPAVRQAYEHTVRHEMKELVALDRTLAQQEWLSAYGKDSRAAGRLHLERLEPLRDQRGVRRYMKAVNEGRANGWHLLVAGVALGLYSIPLRQGLLDYALHTFWNVAGQAAPEIGLTSDDCALLVNELSRDLPQRIQSLIPAAQLAII